MRCGSYDSALRAVWVGGGHDGSPQHMIRRQMCVYFHASAIRHRGTRATRGIDQHTYICIHTYIHTYRHTDRDTYMHTHIHTHAYIRTYTHIHTYTHTHTYIHTGQQPAQEHQRYDDDSHHHHHRRRRAGTSGGRGRRLMLAVAS